MRIDGVRFDAFGSVTFTEGARKLAPRLPASDDATARQAAHRANVRAHTGNDDRSRVARARAREDQINDSTAQPGNDPNALRAELASLQGRTDDQARHRRARIRETLMGMGEAMPTTTFHRDPTPRDPREVINSQIDERRNRGPQHQ
jgi:hypothetical protein